MWQPSLAVPSPPSTPKLMGPKPSIAALARCSNTRVGTAALLLPGEALSGELGATKKTGACGIPREPALGRGSFPAVPRGHVRHHDAWRGRMLEHDGHVGDGLPNFQGQHQQHEIELAVREYMSLLGDPEAQQGYTALEC